MRQGESGLHVTVMVPPPPVQACSVVSLTHVLAHGAPDELPASAWASMQLPARHCWVAAHAMSKGSPLMQRRTAVVPAQPGTHI